MHPHTFVFWFIGILLLGGCAGETGSAAAPEPKPEPDAVSTGCASDKDCPASGEACTQAACTAGGCTVQALDTGPCDDGDSCTINDACQAGTCGGTADPACECKTDVDCADDGDLCNGSSICDVQAHKCLLDQGTVVACPDTDGDPCTAPSCVKDTGKCATGPSNDAGSCDDGNPCSADDACKAGKCEGVGQCLCKVDSDCKDDDNKCNGTMYCDTTTPPYACAVNPATRVKCPPDEDGNPCTLPACQPTTGKCIPVPADPDGTKHIDCDLDASACTPDTCDAKGACQAAETTCKCQQNSDCAQQEDGDPCNGTLYCNKVLSLCEVNPATVVKCPQTALAVCVVDECEPKSGKCAPVAVTDGEKCSDGTECTASAQCKAGECTAVGPNLCVCKTTADCAEFVPANKCLGAMFCNKTKSTCQLNPATSTICNTKDDTACAFASCDPKDGKCKAQATPDGAVCEADGTPCTGTDTCKAGVCGVGDFQCKCAADADCAANQSDPCLGTLYCNKATSYCAVNTANKVVCDDGAACSPLKRDSKDGKCKAAPQPDDAPCGPDGLACLVSRCKAGKCEPNKALKGCACWTTEDCAGFEDGDACNGTLYCALGPNGSSCAVNPATAVTCADDPSTPCLVATCEPADGSCKGKPGHEGASCDDGDACTLKDACADGSCVMAPDSATPDCDDSNVCTADSCNSAKGCQNAVKPGICDDGDACTTGDACKQGVCLPAATTTCDDGNDCTTDGCDPSSGCTAKARGGLPCDDHDACTGQDTCDSATCKGGAAPDCDDSNVCTDDSCDSGDSGRVGMGCLHTFNAAVCDDGDACHQGDVCLAGACTATQDVVCDDKQPCTSDACSAKSGCVFVPIAATCTDDNACTVGDTCDDGSCTPGKAASCDDSNICTNNSCAKASGCVTVNADSKACDDGSLCTKDDKCAGGKCLAGAAVTCDDGNACTTDSCASGTGCTSVANSATCDDGNACTTADKCTTGTCAGGAPLTCDDGNTCTTDACSPTAGCTFSANTASCDDGNACTSGDKCTVGVCSPGEAVDCTGGKPAGCLDYTCNATTGCASTPVSAKCDDANPCTDDACDGKTGDCTHVSNKAKCDDGDNCTLADACSSAKCGGTPVTCDDAELCTTDGCNPSTGGCVFSPNQLPCDDDNACTSGDACATGKCGGTPVLCNDGNVCTLDSCAKQSGCLFSNGTGPCDDGSACSGPDACDSGVCSGPVIDCDDGNACTDDGCDSQTGCKTANNTAACNDGDECTGKDVCKGGACAGPKLDCTDDEPCTDDGCNTAKGCTTNKLADGLPCVGGGCQSGVCTPSGLDSRPHIVAIGRRFGYAVDGARAVHGWGSPVGGELGPSLPSGDSKPYALFGATLPKARAAVAGNLLGCVLDMEGRPICMGYTDKALPPTQVPGAPKIIDFAAHEQNVCGIGDDAKVYCWSSSDFKATKAGFTGNARHIALGPKHTCVINNDWNPQFQNDIYNCWGDGKKGQLGSGQNENTTIDASSPVGGAFFGEFNKIVGICAGDAFTCVAADGEVRCFGEGTRGQLGTGEPGSSPSPQRVNYDSQGGILAVACGAEHACLVDSDGKVRCWGRNHEGQLGDGATIDRASPVELALTNVIGITAYSHTTCALAGNGAVTCWGSNDNAQLLMYKAGKTGDRLFETPVLTSGAVKTIDGYDNSCVIDSGKNLRCWGRHDARALGVGKDDQAFDSPQMVAAGALDATLGELHGCLIKTGSTASCWGYNANNRVTGEGSLGTTYGQPTPLSLANVTRISAGQTHTCALAGGALLCWGNGSKGQVGNGQTAGNNAQTAVQGSLSSVAALDAGYSHTCAIDGAGAAWCWGGNAHGECGTGTGAVISTPVPVAGGHKWTAISAGNQFTCGIEATTNKGFCWGYAGAFSSATQLGNDKATSSAVPVAIGAIAGSLSDISVGNNHACAVAGGVVWCWGYSSVYGQLGNQSTFGIKAAEQPFKALALGGSPFSGVSSVAASRSHTCVLKSGKLTCFGGRDFGQLGTGTAWSKTPKPLGTISWSVTVGKK